MTEPRHEAHERASWAELFFDLVLVFAVTQAAHVAVAGQSWGAVGQTVLLLAIMWWSWVGTTLSVHGVEDSNRQRIFLFACGLCMFVIAIAAPHAFIGQALPLMLAGAHLVLRLLLWAEMQRKRAFSQTGAFTNWVNPFTVTVVAAVILVVAAIAPAGAARNALWIVAVALAFGGPALLARRLESVQFGAMHLPERFATFVIIALGETVASVGSEAAEAHLGVLSWVAVVLIFVLGCGLWWLYFAYGFSAVEHSLRTNQVRGAVVRDVLSYGHVLLVIGLVLVAVGARTMVEHPTETAHGANGFLLPMGATLYVSTFLFTRWRMFGAATVGRFVAAVVLAILTVASPLLPEIATLSAVTAVLVGLNAWEYWVVSTGRPLLLMSRAGSR
ncbi:low temperature requirement protein A [Nocardia tengchongensis]|uniref:Low temperature requirement protein A n=1 Tax=Nocardia tengchongensis TaxID=2055889 RepID=A0ABX8CMS6_9NOCA|nr:low temperature requirement protein A [Nocardia tengchongensis]QVI20879.1 low temperature requirement protein A [Nocardia tengchongensis]